MKKKFLIADLHNDLPSKLFEAEYFPLQEVNALHDTDIPRLIKGKVALQFFACCACKEQYINDPFNTCSNMISVFRERIQESRGIELAQCSLEIEEIIKRNNVAGILALEGGHAIENSLEKLEYFYIQGVRYLTLTWNNSTDWALSAFDEKSAFEGLTGFGKDVIKKMNALGMMIDVAHVGIRTMFDVLEVSSSPVINTHCGVRKLNNHPRNLTDEQIKAIAELGGVIGIVFFPKFLHETGAADLNVVIDHIDYIANLVGMDYVAFGSDFDGIGTNKVKGLDEVSKFPMLIEALNQRGFNDGDITKIAFENVLNVFKKICG